MKKIACVLAVLIVSLLAGVRAQAQNADAIVGNWLDGKGKAHIEIYKTNGKYFGKIVWLKEPTYPADDKKGMAGKEKVDRENPDLTRRTKPLVGLVILRDFVYDGGTQWDSGRIYDPENGKDYKCRMTLKSADALDVRGFIGFSFIGRTENWTRVKGGTQ